MLAIVIEVEGLTTTTTIIIIIIIHSV